LIIALIKAYQSYNYFVNLFGEVVWISTQLWSVADPISAKIQSSRDVRSSYQSFCAFGISDSKSFALNVGEIEPCSPLRLGDPRVLRVRSGVGRRHSDPRLRLVEVPCGQSGKNLKKILIPHRHGVNFISSAFYEQLLHAQIPKVQKETDDMTVFLHFWDLGSKKLRVNTCWWNLP